MIKFILDKIRGYKKVKREKYLRKWSQKEPELIEEWEVLKAKAYDAETQGMIYAMGDFGGSEHYFGEVRRFESKASEVEKKLKKLGFDPDKYKD